MPLITVDLAGLLMAIGLAVAGAYEFGVRRGEKRGAALASSARPAIPRVELTFFGGPCDGQRIVVFGAPCEELRVPIAEGFARYRRLWIGTQEQLVYQGTIDG
jgi:hypothetical protein